MRFEFEVVHSCAQHHVMLWKIGASEWCAASCLNMVLGYHWKDGISTPPSFNYSCKRQTNRLAEESPINCCTEKYWSLSFNISVIFQARGEWVIGAFCVLCSFGRLSFGALLVLTLLFARLVYRHDPDGHTSKHSLHCFNILILPRPSFSSMDEHC